MKKKTILLLMAASMMLGTPAAGAATNVSTQASASVAYTDLQNHYAQGAVARLIQAGIVPKSDPYQPTPFQPNQPIDRVTFGKWLQQVTDLNLSDGQDKNTLDRVTAAMWVSKALSKHHERGANRDASAFKDLGGVSEVGRESIGELYHFGILVGSGDGRFHPSAELTRGEAAVIIDKLLKRDAGAATPVSFHVIKESDSESAYTMVQENKTERGLYSVTDGDSTFVAVSLGEKPTTGYTVKITEVLETKSAVYVKTIEEAPAPGLIVGDVLAYPVSLAKMKATSKPILWLSSTFAQEGANLELQKGEQALLTRQADVDGEGTQETVAVIGTKRNPNNPEQYVEGYVGVFENKKLKQKVGLSSDLLIDPVQLIVADVTGDQKTDIVLDSDQHGNGGKGVHQAAVWVQGAGGQFVKVEIEHPNWNDKVAVSYDKATKTYTLTSKLSDRSWKFEYRGADKATYDPSFAGALNSVEVDPHYELSVIASQLTTRHYVWSGHHALGFADLNATYTYDNGMLKVSDFTFGTLSEDWAAK